MEKSRAESILRSLLDYLDEGIQVVDHQGKTLYYNDAMARVEGLNAEEVIGKKAIEHLKGVEEESSTLLNALKTGEKYVDVIQHYSSYHGKKITTINTTVPIFMDDKIMGAIEISKDMTQLKELNEKICKLQAQEVESRKKYLFKDIIARSESMKVALNKAMRAGLSNSSVLIYGETGSGKEVFAQSIHYNGVRNNKPFIPINCAAIPSALLEGMLFGTVKGSFTGAENKKGLFEEATGGTVLLDEINSMDPTLQSKLLRVLQDGYIRPVGSNKTIDVDVRVIATLNEEPEKLIAEGKLRKDFYYRISVVRINIPPLRERKEDIPLLVKEFIEYYNKILNKSVEGIDQDVEGRFLKYDWPGNIRELKNNIECAMNMAENAKVLTKQYFEIKDFTRNKNIETASPLGLGDCSLQEHLDEIEKNIIFSALQQHNFNISQTAEALKISRQNLQYKMKKHKVP